MTNAEKFIQKSKSIHGELYNYNLVNYVSAHNKVIIICKQHGNFLQSPRHHTLGSGCPKCGSIIRASKNISNTNIFIQKANIIHNNLYNYDLVEYVTAKTKVKIICKIHGIFEQTPDHHLRNRGCPKCQGLNKTTNNFTNEANAIHNFLYDYSLTEYITAKTKVKIICKVHGIFEQTPDNHLHTSQGCPSCHTSKGEIKIEEWLTINNIKFIKQKRFKFCKSKYTLPFDFYIPFFNICIEYDGAQHFIPYSFGSDNTDKTKLNNLQGIQFRDNIKTKYCNNNNINLLRIPYNKNIKKELTLFFQHYSFFL